MEKIESVKSNYEPLRSLLNERGRRLWAAGEAKGLGWGGISLVARAIGLSRTTIRTGIKEINAISEGKAPVFEANRVRRSGGGRKSLEEKDSTLIPDLEKLLEPMTRGDPESALRWTCKSTLKLAAELKKGGHKIGARKVSYLLNQLGYSLQSNRKTKEGGLHKDRNAQFEYINNQTQLYQSRGQPVISVDTKKKELIGDFKNGGRK